MEKLFNKGGRPTDLDVRRRTREFVQALTETGSFVEARRVTGVSAERMARILDEPQLRPLVQQILCERAA